MDLYRRVPIPVRRLVAHPVYHVAQQMLRVAMPLARRLAWAHDGVTETRGGGGGTGGVWVEVGANHGAGLVRAPRDAAVYAFEPNFRLLPDILRVRPDARVIAAAVSDRDGIASLRVASFDASSSLLPFDETQIALQPTEDRFTEDDAILVPTVRLDRFMEAAGIRSIDVLVIDAQGSDLAVLRSLGERCEDVMRIEVEAFLDGRSQYAGAENSREAIVEYLTARGFRLTAEFPIARGANVDLVFQRSAP